MRCGDTNALRHHATPWLFLTAGCMPGGTQKTCLPSDCSLGAQPARASQAHANHILTLSCLKPSKLSLHAAVSDTSCDLTCSKVCQEDMPGMVEGQLGMVP